jgi:tryptophan synthase alpha chain
VGVGFGIRDAATARAIGRSADAVVIGSRIIQLLEGQSGEAAKAAVQQFMSGIRSALDQPVERSA